MATSALATAFVNIVPGTQDLESYLKGKLQDDVAKPGETAGKGFGSKFSSGLKGALVGVGGLFAIKEIAGFAGDLVKSAEEGQKVDAVLSNITTSMGLFGPATDTVTKRLQDFATAQMKLTGIDDDVIKGAQAKLMTFSEVGKSADVMGGAFDRATTLSADLAAAGFGTIDSAATMLGKALQDPEKGITALQRVGVSLSAQQKQQVKDFMAAGDAASAQKVILDEVSRQVGGTAEASATGSEKMKAKWDDLQQGIGTALLPAFNSIVDVIDKNVLPVVEGFAKWLGDNPVMVQVLAAAIGVLALAFVGITIATWAMNTALLANPITWIVIAVVALIAGIVLLIMNWNNVTKAFSDGIKGVAKWFGDLWAGISKGWNTFVKGIGDWLNGIGAWFGKAFAGVGTFFKGLINGWIKMFEDFINFFVRGINGIIGGLNLVLDGIKAATAGAISLRVNPIPAVKLPRLAKGGYVDSPTTALIGEAGPEVVTPLKDFERMMGLDQPQTNERPIYADGIGLIGVMREVARGESRIIFDNNIGRLTLGVR